MFTVYNVPMDIANRYKCSESTSVQVEYLKSLRIISISGD